MMRTFTQLPISKFLAGLIDKHRPSFADEHGGNDARNANNVAHLETGEIDAVDNALEQSDDADELHRV